MMDVATTMTNHVFCQKTLVKCHRVLPLTNIGALEGYSFIRCTFKSGYLERWEWDRERSEWRHKEGRCHERERGRGGERENALLQDRDKMQQVAREEGLRGVDNLVPPPSPSPRPCPSPGATGGWLDCSAPGKEGGGNQVWVAIHLPTVWNSDGRVLTEKKSSKVFKSRFRSLRVKNSCPTFSRLWPQRAQLTKLVVLNCQTSNHQLCHSSAMNMNVFNSAKLVKQH